GVVDFVRREVAAVVMGREAADAQVSEELAHVLSLLRRPFIVGRVELEALVAGGGDGLHRAVQVLGHGVSDRIHFKANGEGGCRASRCPGLGSGGRGNSGGGEEGAACPGTVNVWIHSGHATPESAIPKRGIGWMNRTVRLFENGWQNKIFRMG